MTEQQAAAAMWDAAAPIAAYLGVLAVILLGLALLHETTR